MLVAMNHCFSRGTIVSFWGVIGVCVKLMHVKSTPYRLTQLWIQHLTHATLSSKSVRGPPLVQNKNLILSSAIRP
jgi:hypothetical protein